MGSYIVSERTCQSVYFCTSKASKLSTWIMVASRIELKEVVQVPLQVPVKQRGIDLYPPEYGGIHAAAHGTVHI